MKETKAAPKPEPKKEAKPVAPVAPKKEEKPVAPAPKKEEKPAPVPEKKKEAKPAPVVPEKKTEKSEKKTEGMLDWIFSMTAAMKAKAMGMVKTIKNLATDITYHFSS